MSEELIQIVRETMVSMPKDIEYRVLVDPSEFIRAAINNVFHEVAIGAFLAVCILFLFIGSFKNTVTAAIEIPLSMILAFILMKATGMNLNLISLGGLALSAGMNVDASVVVMENIFRHFEGVKGPLSFQQRLSVITKAVSEVRFAVIASTIASLVVFLPLAFTSALSYAILGDLAWAVVFSHGLSAFVALLLVPTVRLHLMKGGAEKPHHSPIEKQLKSMERFYGSSLRAFIRSPKMKWGALAGIVAALAVLGAGVLPRLPREIIGNPDTDWINLEVKTRGNTLVKQMEFQSDQIESRLLAKFGEKFQYTFTQIQGPNRSQIMARLKNKKEMKAIYEAMETEFANTPFYRFSVYPWNPAELPIPDPPQLRIVVRGGELSERAAVSQQIYQRLEEKQVFPRLWSDPDGSRSEAIQIRPSMPLFQSLRASGSSLTPADLADLARVATEGKKVGTLTVDGRETGIYMNYPVGAISSAEDLAALPVGIGSRVIPLKALARVSVEEERPTILREDERSLFIVSGKTGSEKTEKKSASLNKAQEVLAQWKAERKPPANPKSEPSVAMEDAEKDLNEALRQLATAVALSVLLIFLVLVVQFGSVMNSLLVLVAVPLGFIGVIISLFVFRSTLSLNSILGVILLNGIAVANSIILVDFMKRLVDSGMAPLEAAIEAGQKRLRPILITSLTTILGMTPIALGFGEGGKVLQPLGIAVAGGLWVSMALTLFVVPALQVAFLEKTPSRKHRSVELEIPLGASLAEEDFEESFPKHRIPQHSTTQVERLQ